MGTLRLNSMSTHAIDADPAQPVIGRFLGQYLYVFASLACQVPIPILFPLLMPPPAPCRGACQMSKCDLFGRCPVQDALLRFEIVILGQIWLRSA